MTLSLLGPLTFSGFEHKWYFLCLLIVVGVIGLYVVVQLARHRRMLRFAKAAIDKLAGH